MNTERPYGNLASAVDELLAVDPRDLPTVALGEEIVELYLQASRLQAATRPGRGVRPHRRGEGQPA